VVLDGQHRLAALKALGAKLVPAFLVNYRSPWVKVSSWRPGVRVSKEMVIEAGLSGRKLPPKTSRHVVEGVEVPEVNVPLEALGVKVRRLERIRGGGREAPPKV